MMMYDKLLKGEVVEVDYKLLVALLADMKDINTLLIQKLYNDNYAIKVDEITTERYKRRLKEYEQ